MGYCKKCGIKINDGDKAFDFFTGKKKEYVEFKDGNYCLGCARKKKK